MSDDPVLASLARLEGGQTKLEGGLARLEAGPTKMRIDVLDELANFRTVLMSHMDRLQGRLDALEGP